MRNSYWYLAVNSYNVYKEEEAENAVEGGKNEKCKRLEILKEKVRNFPWHPEEGHNE